MTVHALLATLSGVVLATFAGSQARHEPVKTKVTELQPFTVVGISARTTNAKEMSGQGVIGKQWERLMKENLLSKIPNRSDANTIALYTDYENDANGAYTVILGAKVSSAEDVPTGMVAVKVPAGKYTVFTSGRGPVGKVVPETWSRIWTSAKSALGGARTYKTDFELYDQRSADPQNAQVDIYVGIK